MSALSKSQILYLTGKLVDLINSKPRSPLRQEIADILGLVNEGGPLPFGSLFLDSFMGRDEVAKAFKKAFSEMTTDPDEGRRQIEAMLPPPLQPGDLVRLRAGGERVMTIVELEDYGNMAVCQWQAGEPGLETAERETFPVGSLVKVGDGEQAGAGPQG